MDKHSIFHFTDPIDYLNYELEAKRKKNEQFSLRAWSRQLGYDNPSFLSHVLKKRRKLKPDTASRFVANLKLQNEFKRYFELLVLMENCKTVDERRIYMDLLESLRAQNHEDAQPLNLEVFRIIVDWHHTAILEMLDLKDFRNDLQYIFDRLGGEVTISEIEKALERLLRLELIELLPSGRLKRVKDNPVLVENTIPSDAIRYYHKQMIEKAVVAIDKQSIEERDIRGSTVSIRASDYDKALNIVRKAHAELMKLSANGKGDETYHLNSQFFKVTKRKDIL